MIGQWIFWKERLNLWLNAPLSWPSCSLQVSLGADLPHVAFRALRSEWAQLGYIADPDTLSSFEGPLDM